MTKIYQQAHGQKGCVGLGGGCGGPGIVGFWGDEAAPKA
jgi:hypothetical protein